MGVRIRANHAQFSTSPVAPQLDVPLGYWLLFTLLFFLEADSLLLKISRKDYSEKQQTMPDNSWATDDPTL
jgi:hypothetical protein